MPSGARRRPGATSGGRVRVLAAPARRALASAGIADLADLARFSEAELAALHGMGPNALAKLRTEMAERGVRFAGS